MVCRPLIFFIYRPIVLHPQCRRKHFQNDHDEEDEDQWPMYIHEGEEENTGEEEWVDAGGFI